MLQTANFVIQIHFFVEIFGWPRLYELAKKLAFTLALTIVALHLVGFALVGLHHSLVFLIARLLPFVLYVCLPAATLILTVGVTFSTHPVHALLCLIAVFFNTVVIYLLAGAEFLAFVFLIVYVGAIAILFLFVIRLLNVKDLTATRISKLDTIQKLSRGSAVPAGLLFSVIALRGLEQLNLSIALQLETKSTSLVTNLVNYLNFGFQDIAIFSTLLYTYYTALFLLVSLLLLTARLGAIILATAATDHEGD